MARFYSVLKVLAPGALSALAFVSHTPAGEPGPVLWTAVVQDMQIEGQMPDILLAPPGAGPGVVGPPEQGR